MFSKDDIKRGDLISFYGSSFFPVLAVTSKIILIRIDKYTTQSIRRNAVHFVKINGRYYAQARLKEVIV
ncbi:hypothetical protein [Lactococcus petauri]|uniref:hypothetical protein n=1 Tax=Lactococcus petauri TaxID=1940789 RepID=UPI001F57A51B|nr:hypothetical protein [Lactococcus petauri]